MESEYRMDIEDDENEYMMEIEDDENEYSNESNKEKYDIDYSSPPTDDNNLKFKNEIVVLLNKVDSQYIKDIYNDLSDKYKDLESLEPFMSISNIKKAIKQYSDDLSRKKYSIFVIDLTKIIIPYVTEDEEKLVKNKLYNVYKKDLQLFNKNIKNQTQELKDWKELLLKLVSLKCVDVDGDGIDVRKVIKNILKNPQKCKNAFYNKMKEIEQDIVKKQLELQLSINLSPAQKKELISELGMEEEERFRQKRSPKKPKTPPLSIEKYIQQQKQYKKPSPKIKIKEIVIKPKEVPRIPKIPVYNSNMIIRSFLQRNKNLNDDKIMNILKQCIKKFVNSVPSPKIISNRIEKLEPSVLYVNENPRGILKTPVHTQFNNRVKTILYQGMPVRYVYYYPIPRAHIHNIKPNETIKSIALQYGKINMNDTQENIENVLNMIKRTNRIPENKELSQLDPPRKYLYIRTQKPQKAILHDAVEFLDDRERELALNPILEKLNDDKRELISELKNIKSLKGMSIKEKKKMEKKIQSNIDEITKELQDIEKIKYYGVADEIPGNYIIKYKIKDNEQALKKKEKQLEQILNEIEILKNKQNNAKKISELKKEFKKKKYDLDPNINYYIEVLRKGRLNKTRVPSYKDKLSLYKLLELKDPHFERPIEFLSTKKGINDYIKSTQLVPVDEQNILDYIGDISA